MATPQKISTCLWFEKDPEEAVGFYVSLFGDARILHAERYGDWGPGPAGTVAFIIFELAGTTFQALTGRPAAVDFSMASSMFVQCDDQAEIDRLWDALAEGGEEIACGWVRDRYGLAWQIVPRAIGDLLMKGDAARSNRMMQAVMHMTKLDIATLEKAYHAD
jgi:predicted 3-demethylubiquinone-9 3-methyltransferase (glyoxalase superfamily)